MALPLTSRYNGLEVYDAPVDPETVQPTVPIRPTLPAPASNYNHLVMGTENLDYLAWRYLGASEFWWRIADANPLVFPTDIQTGTSLKVPDAASAGRIERTRRF